jgi:hypothetical protein
LPCFIENMDFFAYHYALFTAGSLVRIAPISHRCALTSFSNLNCHHYLVFNVHSFFGSIINPIQSQKTDKKSTLCANLYASPKIFRSKTLHSVAL